MRFLLVLVLLLGLGLPAFAEEEAPSGGFGAPTGGVFDLGEEEGFGFGPLQPDPTVLQGPNRQPVVLPWNPGFVGRYAVRPTERQRFLAELTGGSDLWGADLSYAWQTSDTDVVTANLAGIRARQPVFQHGERGIGLPPDDVRPWVDRAGGGVEFARNLGDLRLATGATWQTVDVRRGAFSSDLFRTDRLGNPVTVSPDGRDDLAMLRVGGLYTTLDDLAFPTEGTKLRFGVDQALGTASFLRSAVNWTQFMHTGIPSFREGQDTLLVFNLQGGWSTGTLPPYEAFSLGGPDSVRGWAAGALAAGKSFVQSTIEARIPLAEVANSPVRLVVFGDYGSDLGTGPDVFGQPGTARWKPGSGAGFGGGLQAITPIGLLRLEAGWNGRGDSQVNFSFGDRF